MSLVAAPCVRPIGPAVGVRTRRALVSARSVVRNNDPRLSNASAFERGCSVAQTRCRPAGRRSVRVSCRASEDSTAGDAENDLPSRPRSILSDLTRSESPVEPSRASTSASDAQTTPSKPRLNRGAAKPLAATAFGGAALFAAASTLPVGMPAAPLPATASTASTSLVASVTTGSSRTLEKTQKHINSTLATYKEYSAGEIFAYKVQKVFGLPLLGKVLCLFVLTIPIVFMGGLGYKLADYFDASEDSDPEDEESFREKLKSAYFNLFDIPGADATTDDTWRSGVVTQAIVFVGMFVFAVIIGIISDEIATKVEEVKTGNNRVIEKEHTVVLNWNPQLVPLLKQMAVAKSERAGTFDKPIVLLADLDKELMDELVEQALEDCPATGKNKLEVVTRRGNPFDADDLRKVNAHEARRVILLHPHERGSLSGESSDDRGDGVAGSTAEERFIQKQQREEALKATVVLNLLADHGREYFPDVVVQMPYRLPAKQDLVGHALRLSARGGGAGDTFASNASSADSDPVLVGESFRSARAGPANSPYVQVHGSENTGKISAFAAFQPGTSKIFEQLFKQSEDTPEFYLSHAPQFVGKTFGEAWRMLPEATLCGLSHPDGRVTLAPSDDVVVGELDEVVMLSETSTVAVAASADVQGVPPRGSQRQYMRRMPSTSPGPMKILFAGWNAESATALGLAQSMAPTGSEITILSDEAIARGESARLRSTRNCKLRIVQGVPTAYTDLQKVKVHDMDAVIIMPDHSRGKAEGDASALATILQIRAVCCDFSAARGGARRDPHVVATLNTETARSIVELMGAVGNGDSSPDVIMSDEIVGGALLQVAANPRLAGLFDALLATEGHEMYLRDADAFGGADARLGGPDGVSGGSVTWGTICERARERDELALGVLRVSGDFVISPRKSTPFAFERGDRIAVLADQL